MRQIVKDTKIPIDLLYAVATSEEQEPDNEIYALERIEADKMTKLLTREYSTLVEVALRRFPSGRVSTVELKRRASRINLAGKPVGYHLGPYSHLSRDELWDYLTDVRRHVARLGEIHCPETLDRVKLRNSRIKSEQSYVI